jgi:DNA invertase Pin-like site-specific DNA recombinase
MSMKVGYARTSTTKQDAGLEVQMRDLDAAGCEKIFSEQLSSVDAQREQLEAAIEFCRAGDVLVVTKLDRLARSVANLCEIEARLSAKSVGLIIQNPAMDTSTSTGRLVFNMFASVAQFEREVMLERQRDGIKKAQSEGKYRGRKPLAPNVEASVLALKAENVSVTEIAKRLGIARQSIYRILERTGAE